MREKKGYTYFVLWYLLYIDAINAKCSSMLIGFCTLSKYIASKETPNNF